MSSCTKWHSVLHIARCLQLLIRMLGKQDESKILQKLNKIMLFIHGFPSSSTIYFHRSELYGHSNEENSKSFFEFLCITIHGLHGQHLFTFSTLSTDASMINDLVTPGLKNREPFCQNRYTARNLNDKSSLTPTLSQLSGLIYN